MPQSSTGQHPERGNSQRGCSGCEKVSQTSVSEQRFSGDLKVINRSVFDLFRYLFELLTTGCCKRACVPCETGENNTICLSATLERSCLQIKTNSGYPWFPLTITLKWGGLVCQSGGAHTGGLLCNRRNEGVLKHKPGKQTIGDSSQQGKKKMDQCCFIKKTFVPDQAFQNRDATQPSPPHSV